MEEHERSNEMSCLAKLDFKIMCELFGKENAIQILLLSSALEKETMISNGVKPVPPEKPKPDC